MKRSGLTTLKSVATFVFSVFDLIRGLATAHKVGLTELKGLVGVTLAVMVYFAPDDRISGKQPGGATTPVNSPDLIRSLKVGVSGGLLGGLAAGLPFGFYYYFTALAHEGPPQNRFLFAVGSVSEFVVYSLLVGAMIGVFVQSFLYASEKYKGFSVIMAGAVGGAIAGLVLGLIAGAKFILRDTDPVSYGWLIGMATFGAAWIACGSLLSQYKLNLSKAVRAVVIVLLIEIIIAVAGRYLLAKSGIDLTSPANSVMALNVGGEIGLICGVLLGVQISATQVVYRFLNEQNGESLAGKKGSRDDKRSPKRRGRRHTRE